MILKEEYVKKSDVISAIYECSRDTKESPTDVYRKFVDKVGEMESLSHITDDTVELDFEEDDWDWK